MTPTTAETKHIDRRGFLQWLMSGLLFLVATATGNALVRYLLPPPPARKTEGLSIPINQIPTGSALVVEHDGSPVILVRTQDGVKAFSSVCTHLGCLVKWVSAEKIFYCPCHAGKFDITGRVIAGPPPEPLRPVGIEIRNDTVFFT
jgi:cytochrome b6-f complex iron-sulfur subunit